MGMLSTDGSPRESIKSLRNWSIRVSEEFVEEVRVKRRTWSLLVRGKCGLSVGKTFNKGCAE